MPKKYRFQSSPQPSTSHFPSLQRQKQGRFIRSLPSHVQLRTLSSAPTITHQQSARCQWLSPARLRASVVGIAMLPITVRPKPATQLWKGKESASLRSLLPTQNMEHSLRR